MVDRGLALDALLLKEVVPRSARCGRQVLLLLVLLIGLGCAVILSCVSRGDQQHLPIQEATITMAHHFQILPTALKHFKPFPMASTRFRSFSAAQSSFFRDMSLRKRRAKSEEILPRASTAELTEAVAATRSKAGAGTGEQPTLWEEKGQRGTKAWILGAMNATDPKTTALWNHPLMTTFQLASQGVLTTHPPVKGVLARSDRAALAHFLTGKLVDLRHSVLNFTNHGASTLKQYGAAGFVSVLVESVLYWIFIIVPVSAYMYHEGPGASGGAWLPTLSDPESVAEFGKMLGGTYLFSKIPPIEAARWAWAFAMIPWFQERMPVMTPPVVNAPSELESRAQQD